ncbi:GNAT family N-acetyltransferase [Kitasatospora cheerisanensis]|uniref:Acetyltransferase n=1 Tax=Kitasatospora cheerisanensis KCTC 2395 TaxID=1348663 RepID=A0A066Z6R8_9ACTN|nr:GNAT family N-acetyltransferase [Kitasatospora cheerisanensis]KDN87939.1 acetyltransferase [Kitasatospora cheerisanensis KCTC 2395]
MRNSLHDTGSSSTTAAEGAGPSTVLARLEEFYDAVPRFSATAEDYGPLTLFVRTGPGWHYYGRPTLGGDGQFTAADVDRVRARQRKLGAPETFEWVHETTPGLRAAIEASGLEVHEHPLLVLELDGPSAAAPAAEDGPEVRVLTTDDPLLPSAVAVPHLAFAEPGTLVGAAGPEQLADATRTAIADGQVTRMIGRMEAGRTVVAATVGPDGLASASGCHQPVGGVSEIVAVATLPSLRRQGLARRVTAHLVEHARATGIRTVFLSASDDAVARIYESIGFRRAATALIAEPATEAATS